MTLAGATFEIDLMPISERERSDAFKQFHKNKQLVNPLTKNMELVPFFDINDPEFRQVAEDLLDKVIVDFRGIGDNDFVPLDGKLRENKLLLGSIEVEEEEVVDLLDANGEKAAMKVPRTRFFRTLILDKAVSLSKAIAEADEKNS
jgi:hypothetical protein